MVVREIIRMTEGYHYTFTINKIEKGVHAIKLASFTLSEYGAALELFDRTVKAQPMGQFELVFMKELIGTRQPSVA